MLLRLHGNLSHEHNIRTREVSRRRADSSNVYKGQEGIEMLLSLSYHYLNLHHFLPLLNIL